MPDMSKERHGQFLLFAGLFQAKLGMYSDVTGRCAIYVPFYLENKG